MKLTNRLSIQRADYLFKLVRRPIGWIPTQVTDVPPHAELLSVCHVASYEEAMDDLLRSNHLSIDHDLDQWAIVESTAGDL